MLRFFTIFTTFYFSSIFINFVRFPSLKIGENFGKISRDKISRMGPPFAKFAKVSPIKVEISILSEDDVIIPQIIKSTFNLYIEPFKYKTGTIQIQNPHHLNTKPAPM